MPESYEPGQYEYHYDKKDRLSRQSEWMKNYQQPKSFFQRNRMMIIVFSDILFIMLVFFIFNPFSLLGTPRLSGYLIRTRAFYFDGEVMATVTLKPGKDAAKKTAEGEGVLLEVYAGESSDAETLSIRDNLSLTEETKLRASLNMAEAPKNVRIRLTIGDKDKELKIPLEKE